MSNVTTTRRYEQGLCILCGLQPFREGRKTCQGCSDKHNEYTKIKQASLMTSGLCSCCGKNQLCNKRFCQKCADRHNRKKAIKYQTIKDAVFEAYGGYICSCCGEDIKAFLSIDHIDGGGKKHREDIKVDFYSWLKRNNYPSGYQVLCMNCQFGRKNCGVCPHQTMRG